MARPQCVNVLALLWTGRRLVIAFALWAGHFSDSCVLRDSRYATGLMNEWSNVCDETKAGRRDDDMKTDSRGICLRLWTGRVCVRMAFGRSRVQIRPGDFPRVSSVVPECYVTWRKDSFYILSNSFMRKPSICVCTVHTAVRCTHCCSPNLLNTS